MAAPALAVIGHNNPPQSPFEAVSVHASDLLLEAGNWLDGTTIVQDEATAAVVAKLVEDLRKAEKAAEDARKTEAKPFDEAKVEVQKRYKPLLTQLADAITAGKAVQARWLVKVRERQQAEAEAARKAAEEAAAAARAAAQQAAGSTNMDDLTAAREQIQQADAAAKAADRAEKAKPRQEGGARAMTLRTYWTATALTPDDPEAAKVAARDRAAWAWTNHRGECEALFLDLANRDVRGSGKRQLPGFVVTSEERAV